MTKHERSISALLLNAPPDYGAPMVREGRCQQRRSVWGTTWPPVTLATIAALLEREGVRIAFEEGILPVAPDRFRRRIAAMKPDIVFLNMATPSLHLDLQAARRIKTALPRTLIFALGIHASAEPEDLLRREDALHGVLVGEPEMTALEVALAARDAKPMDDIAGLRLRNNAVSFSSRPFLKDLDALPFPAWGHITPGHYRLPISGEPFLLVATSRGCFNRCRFCANKTIYGDRLRKRSPASIVEEISRNAREFGIRHFLFWAESFTLDRDFCLAICEEIKRSKEDFHWVCNSRTDNVDAQLLRSMREAGCFLIGYGVESASQRILDLMGKGVAPEQHRAAIRSAKEAGLAVMAHCMIGYPGETESEIMKTVEFILGEPLEFAQFYCAIPYPGSELYDLACKHGWLTSMQWEHFEQSLCVLNSSDLSPERVEALRGQAYRRFYLRPRQLLRIARFAIRQRPSVHALRQIRDFLSWSRGREAPPAERYKAE